MFRFLTRSVFPAFRRLWPSRVETLCSDRQGSITLLFALSLLATLGVAALVLEGSELYIYRVKGQRVADLAVVAAASLSSPISNGAVTSEAQATVTNIGAINGYISSATPTATLVASAPSTTTLTVTATTPVSLLLGGFLGNVFSATVSNASTAKVGSTVGPCIVSTLLVSILGPNTTITGPECSIEGNLGVAVGIGSEVTASLVETSPLSAVGEALLLSLGGTTTLGGLPASSNPSRIISGSITDPEATTTAVENLVSDISSLGLFSQWPFSSLVTSLLSSFPPGTATSLSNQSAGTIANTTAVSALTVTNSTVTITGTAAADPNCSHPMTIGTMNFVGTNTVNLISGCYEIGNSITVISGSTTFVSPSGGSVTFLIGGSIVNNGTGTLVFGDATFQIDGGLANQSSGAIQFGNGQVYMNGGSITNAASGSLFFASGPFYIAGG
jgi:hypothetical protein